MTDQATECSADDAAKRTLRSRYIAARRALPPERRRAADASIRRQVCALLAEIRNALGKPAVVGLYAPVRGEVDVLPLLGPLRAAGWRTALPRVTGPGEMVFCDVAKVDELVPGAFGIPEPAGDAPVLPPGALAAVIVPGVAFAPDGRRLGYGGGFYDRWLAQAQVCAARIGVCYASQLDPNIPAATWDVPMDYVVTEAGICRCSGSA